MRPERRRDRGAAEALGLVLIAPAAIGLAVLVVMLGRGVDANAQVRSAAESAAQAAALERDPASAAAAARAVAAAMLGRDDSCSRFDVAVRYDSSSVGAPGLNRGRVEVTVECSVSNRGLEIVQRSDRLVRATAFAMIDPFRSGARQ